ncbi:MAG: hypothetical protein AB7O28_04835 [Vicinamibacterales bacterium]
MEVNVDPQQLAAASFEAAREVLVLRKQRDVETAVAQSVVDLVRNATPAAPGRIDTYA